MAMALNPIEFRVLGVLIEKSLSHPAYYPMTLNAITAACSQKTNRDPVMQLDEGEVASALHGLQQWQLVSQADPDRGTRANRFRHEVEQRFGWNAAQRAVMAELFLRGPQTLGEIRSRASRMTRLEALDYAKEIVEELMRTDPPMIVELPREPGKSTTRFAHLLGGEVTAESPPPAEPSSPAAAPATAPSPTPATASLASRVDAIEKELSTLRAEFTRLREDLGASGTDP